VSLARIYLDAVIGEYENQRRLAEGAIAQLSDAELSAVPDPESNSVLVIMKHVGGNLRSRWRDFLTTDGEKPDRDRDAEFEASPADGAAVRALWEEGWRVLLDSLAGLSEADLERTVYVRSEPHTVVRAIERSLAHTGYHVGQIVYAAKASRGGGWRTLSIARGQSRVFREAMRQRHEAPGGGPPAGA